MVCSSLVLLNFNVLEYRLNWQYHCRSFSNECFPYFTVHSKLVLFSNLNYDPLAWFGLAILKPSCHATVCGVTLLGAWLVNMPQVIQILKVASLIEKAWNVRGGMCIITELLVYTTFKGSHPNALQGIPILSIKEHRITQCKLCLTLQNVYNFPFS